MEALPKPTERRAKMSSETSIVQCPACSTKFSLKTTILDQQPAARFHCSRCDHVFSIDLPHDAATGGAPEGPEPPSSSTPKSQIELDFRVAEAASINLKSPNTDFRVASSKIEALKNVGLGTQPEISAPTQSKLGTPPKVNALRGDQTSRALETFARPQPLQFDFSKASVAPDTQIRPYTSSPRPSSDIKRSPGRWASAGMLIGVLILSILAYSVLGFLIGLSPSLAERLFALTPKAEQAAPADVFVRSAKIERVILDGGQNVTVLSGVIQNESLTNYRSVEIEAALYDSNDAPFASVLTSTSSGIAKDRLKSYPPAMLDVLQHSKSPRLGEVKAGERKEFMAVFTDERASAAKFFSTRVYTVTE